MSDCLIGINLFYAPVPYSQVGGVNDKMFTPCVINDKICSKDTIAVSLNFLEFLPIQEWIMATYHIAQYIITVAAMVAKDGVRDKIE